MKDLATRTESKSPFVNQQTIDKCIRNHSGSCYGCKVYVLACPEVINALYESTRQLGPLMPPPKNTRVVDYGNLCE